MTKQTERIAAHRYASDMKRGRLFFRHKAQRLCSYCKRIPVGQEWIYAKRSWMDYFDENITHGICPGCARSLKYREEIQRAKG